MKNFITPTRHFNDLTDFGDYFVKSSIDIDKIAAEIKFYENLSDDFSSFYPKYLGRSTEGKWPTGYKIQKINNSDLSTYFTGLVENSENYFIEFFNYVGNYFKKVPKKICNKDEFLSTLNNQIFYRNKRRLNSLKSTSIFQMVETVFANNGHSNIDDFLNLLHEEITHEVEKMDKYELWFSHGDLCLSNIIIDDNKMFLVDPRGIQLSSINAFLIPQYDLAKLSQCILGGYDFINHNLDTEFKVSLESEFKDFLNMINKNFKLVRLIEASHFLAMLPLHINTPEKVLKFAEQSIKTRSEVS